MFDKQKWQREYMRKRYNTDPEHRRKHLARVATKRMVKKPCSKCMSSEAEKHHEDYTKPLEVVWLCRSCHLELHSE